MTRIKSALLSLLALAAAACGPSTGGFRYQIDAALQPAPRPSSTQPVDAIQDDEKKTTYFVANQLLVATSDLAQAEAVAARYSGRVVGNDAVPEPPAGSGLTLKPEFLTPTQFTVEIDTAAVSLAALADEATAAGFKGEARFSSEAGAKLFAVLVKEKQAGVSVAPNLVHQGALLTSSREHPDGFGGNFDAFTFAPFASTGAKSNVHAAWQLVAAHNSFTPVWVAVIDSGFWLDATGKPMSSVPGPAWVSDFDASPVQYDFAEDDRLAGGPSLMNCTGGSVCNWHGDGSAATASGALDNQYGGAGSGALVSKPMLFRVAGNVDQEARAIRTAVAWGASVINMSLGGECDNFICDGYLEFNMYPALRNARDNGVVVVAAAGNSTLDTHSVPCKGDAVICVGALDDFSQNAIGYSNWGQFVDLWAPTNILTQPTGDTTPNLDFHGGTSAASPFVAGVVAMLKAHQGSLTSDQVLQILRDTGWSSPDARVTRAVNAYAALRRVIPRATFDAPPHLTISSPPTAMLNRGLQVRANAFDLEDGSPCCQVTWSPAASTSTSEGRAAVVTFDTLGARDLAATATDSQGNTFTARTRVEVVNAPPVPVIHQPLESATFYQGATVSLLGSATDQNVGPGPGPGTLPCAQLTWFSSAADAAFPVTGCSPSVVFGSTGTRLITLAATDPADGSIVTAARVLTVLPPPFNYPPNVALGSLPPPNYSGGYAWDQPINVTASATDVEGNTPLSYAWRITTFRPNSSVVFATATIGNAANLSWTPQNTPALWGDYAAFGNACYDGQPFDLRLEVRDSLGNTTTRQVASPPFPRVYRCIVF